MMIKNKDKDNQSKKITKKAVPAKGEPHFKMGELITKLNVIKDDPSTILDDRNRCEYNDEDKENECSQPYGSMKNYQNLNPNPGNVSQREHLEYKSGDNERMKINNVHDYK